MLRLLAPRSPIRTTHDSLFNIVLDSGKSRVIFNNVTNGPRSGSTQQPSYLVTNHLPPAPGSPNDIDSPNSSLCPPFHIHLREDETFRVISGKANFLLVSQQPRQTGTEGVKHQHGIVRHSIMSGESFTIPRGLIHTFRNASRTENLVLEFGFSAPDSTADEQALNAKMKRFFLNTQLYRSDCNSQGIPRSLLQVLLFNYDADVALVPNWLLSVHSRFPLLRSMIERAFAPNLGRFMNFWGGVVIGKCLMGLKGSYEEYCPPSEIESLTKVDYVPEEVESPSTAQAMDTKPTNRDIKRAESEDCQPDPRAASRSSWLENEPDMPRNAIGMLKPDCKCPFSDTSTLGGSVAHPCQGLLLMGGATTHAFTSVVQCCSPQKIVNLDQPSSYLAISLREPFPYPALTCVLCITIFVTRYITLATPQGSTQPQQARLRSTRVAMSTTQPFPTTSHCDIIVPLPRALTDQVPREVWEEIAAQTINTYSIMVEDDQWVHFNGLSAIQINSIADVSKAFEKGINIGLKRYFSGQLRITVPSIVPISRPLPNLPCTLSIKEVHVSIYVCHNPDKYRGIVELLRNIRGLQALVMTFDLFTLAQISPGHTAWSPSNPESKRLILFEANVQKQLCFEIQTEIAKELPGVKCLVAYLPIRKWNDLVYVSSEEAINTIEYLKPSMATDLDPLNRVAFTKFVRWTSQDANTGSTALQRVTHDGPSEYASSISQCLPVPTDKINRL